VTKTRYVVAISQIEAEVLGAAGFGYDQVGEAIDHIEAMRSPVANEPALRRLEDYRIYTVEVKEPVKV
jgi:hypothetical protein